MDYHKDSSALLFREYGRNVQRMVEHLVTVADRAQRTQMAHETVRVMSMLAPNNKEMQDYRKKLWDHLYVMAGPDLDVDAPYPPPAPEAEREAAPRLAYDYHASKLRQYGRNVELMIEKAVAMEAGPAREAYVRMIATYMKVALLSKSGGAATLADGAASDQVVFDHLARLSGGELRLSNTDTQLMPAQQIVSRASISSASQPLYTRKKKKKPVQGIPMKSAGVGGDKRRKKRRR